MSGSVRGVGVFFLSLLMGGCAGEHIAAGRTPLSLAGARVEKRVSSWKALREQHVVMQGLDYSCGAAALATLIRFYFEEDVTESQVLSAILSSLSEVDIQEREQNGLSLLDLKRYAEQAGYQAVAVKLSYAALPTLKGPILIHLDRGDYRHFAVLRGVRGDRVYLADPSRGNMRMSIDRFGEEWTGVALILGRQGFGLPVQHPLALGERELIPDEALVARRALYVRP